MALKSPAKNSSTSLGSKTTKARAPRTIKTTVSSAVAVSKASPIIIDYPQSGETLYAGTYSIRISAPTAEHVEVSINSGEWLVCRLQSGFWWYDWALWGPGSLTIMARMRTPDGAWLLSMPCDCQYPG